MESGGHRKVLGLLLSLSYTFGSGESNTHDILTGGVQYVEYSLIHGYGRYAEVIIVLYWIHPPIGRFAVFVRNCDVMSTLHDLPPLNGRFAVIVIF